MKTKFNKFISLFLVFVMIFSILPANIFENVIPEIKAVNANDVNNDNWTVGLKLYDTTNGKTQITNIDWNSTQAEEKTYELVIEYSNTVAKKDYAPGEIKIELDSILDNIRDVNDICLTEEFTGTVESYEIKYFVNADKTSETTKKTSWSYYTETTGKEYYNVPTKFILTNNNKFDAGSSYNGTIAFSFTLNSITIPNNSTGTYGAVLKTDDGSQLYTDTFDFNFTSTKKNYELNSWAEPLKSAEGTFEGAENYIWAKYHVAYDINADISPVGVREAFSKYLRVTVPTGAFVYDSSYQKLTPESGNTYNLGEYKETLEKKTLQEAQGYTENKIVIIAYPAGTSTMTTDFSLYGTYRDEISETLLATKNDSRSSSGFAFDYEGDVYFIGNTVKDLYTNAEKVYNGTANPIWNLYYGARYKNEIGSINLLCASDLMYAQNTNDAWYQMTDSEYEFVSFDTTYKGNKENYGLRTLETGFDRSNQYEVAIYVRYKNTTNYVLWQQGKFTADSLGTKVIFPEGVVGVQFKILNLASEDIELCGDLEVNLNSTTVKSDSHIYNFSYLQAEEIDGTQINHAATEDNYLSENKDIIMAYDTATYGKLMFRDADYTILTDTRAYWAAEKTFDTSSVVVDAENEKIEFNYLFHTTLNTRITYDTTKEFIGFRVYDLLPQGIKLEADADTLKANIANSWGHTEYHYSNTLTGVENLHDYYFNHTTVNVTENYLNSGRDLIEIIFDFSDDPMDLTKAYEKAKEVYPESTGRLFSIIYNAKIPCSISFDDWYTYGATYTNYLYLLDSNKPHNYTFKPNYSYFLSNSQSPEIGRTTDAGIFETLLNDMDKDENTTEEIGYEKLTTTIIAPMNTHTDLIKTISTDGENFTKETVRINYDSPYYYKLRASIGVDNNANNLVIYDSIENISSGWKGIVTGFDTSWAEAKGLTVKIYYSTNDAGFTTDLTNSFWQEYNTSINLSAIKHVAFKFLDSKGNPATFTAGSAAQVVIEMKSTNILRTEDMETSNNARFTANSLDATGNVLEVVDLSSNTVRARLPKASLKIYKTIPRNTDDFYLMDMDPYGQYSFNIRLKEKNTNALVIDKTFNAKNNTGNTVTRTEVSLTNWKIGETYIVEEILPSGSLFAFENITSKNSMITVSNNNGQYEFTINKDAFELDTDEEWECNEMEVSVNNSIIKKTVNLNISKIISGTDKAFAGNNVSKDDEFSFNIKLTNKNDPENTKTGTISNKTGLTLNNIYPGTYTLQEVNIQGPWVQKLITELNTIDGISLNLVNGIYEVTISNTITNGVTYNLQIENELQEIGDPEIKVIFNKVITGTDEAYANLNLNSNNEYNFQINLNSENYNVNGIVTNKNALTIIKLPAGNYTVNELNDPCFNLASMEMINSVNGVTLTKENGVYVLNVSENVLGTEIVYIQVNNELVEDIYYNEKQEKINLVKVEPAIFSITYELNGGVNNANNPNSYDIYNTGITLQEPTREGYQFLGWYKTSTFTDNPVTNIPQGTIGNIQLYAKWGLLNTYAIYSDTDNSFRFYRNIDTPTVGTTYQGRRVTAKYTGFETSDYYDYDPDWGGSTLAPWYSYAENITSVVVVDEISPISTASWFRSFNNCATYDVSNLNMSKVTNTASMFEDAGVDCDSLTITGMENWDVSNVEIMEEMFCNWVYDNAKGSAPISINIGNLGNWNVSSVTNMTRMFFGFGHSVDNLNINNYGLQNWDVSNVTKMNQMFHVAGQHSTTVYVNLNNWANKLSNVTTMSSMFAKVGQYASTVNIQLSNWKLPNVKSFNSTFEYCGYSTSNFDLSTVATWTLGSATDMASMFAFTGYSSSTWTIGDISNWDVSTVQQFGSYFDSVPSDNRSYMPNGMFYYAGYSASTFNPGNLGKWNVSSATDMTAMFSYSGYNSSTWYIGDISSWNVSNVKYFGSVIDTYTNSNGGTSVQNAQHGMFFWAGRYCTNINVGNLASWNTKSAINMNCMFWGFGYSDTDFTFNLSNWNVSNVSEHKYFNEWVNAKITQPTWVN